MNKGLPAPLPHKAKRKRAHLARQFVSLRSWKRLKQLQKKGKNLLTTLATYFYSGVALIVNYIMAAVQQRSPTDTDPPAAASHKDGKFIESMEDEVRRCAEHLERRQSRKRSYRSLERKSNGYSSASGNTSGPATTSRSITSAQTLPRSFTLPSDPEERSVLSPRVNAQGARSPVRGRKSPKPHVFKFVNTPPAIDGSGSFSPQQQQHIWDDTTGRSSPCYHKGNSAPPEVSPFFSAGSGSCSRDNSVTPLPSPLCRTPIGAVASHTRSRRSSHSGSPPPPAVPPKRQSASPPPVPPKPSAKTRRGRPKSYTPTSPTSTAPIKPRKIEITSVRNDSLRLSSPPPAPMDPDLVSKLSADTRKDSIEFPSAEVDLGNFHEKVAKAKSLLKECTERGGGGGSYGVAVESSVDAEDYSSASVPLRQASAPPTLGPAAEKVGSPTSSREPSTSQIGEGRCEKLKTDRLKKDTVNDAPRPLPLRGVESSVDATSVGVADSKLQEATGKATVISSDMSLGDPNSYPSNSDSYISNPSMRDSEMSVEDTLVTSSEQSVAGQKEREGGGGEGDIQRNVDELLEELSTTKTEVLPRSSLMSDTKPAIATPSQSKPKISGDEDTKSSEPTPEGAMPVKEAEKNSAVPDIPVPATIPTVHVDTDANQPETKSISQLSHVASNKLGSQKVQRTSRHSRNSRASSSEDREATPDTPKNSAPSSPEDSSTDKPLLDTEASKMQAVESQAYIDSQLVGVSESVVLVVKELQIKLREKEEDLGRLQRQRDRELKEKDEKIKKLLKESKKVEREKWELLKRARDAAERSLHLRTQLDMKEGSLRGVQSELDRTRDELVSVKSANTSLRALLSDLRGSRPASSDIGIQVDYNSASLRRNPSIELAFTQGGLSQDQDLDRTAIQRMSSSSLGLDWPEGRWEREGGSVADTTSLQDESPMTARHPLGSRESRRSRKRGVFLSKMIRSSGKRGSRTSITSGDGLDLSQSSLIQGVGLSSTNVGSPYHVVPSTLKRHWQVLGKVKGTPFSKWELPAVVAWVEAELGMGQYSKAVCERYASGSALLSLSESDMEKKLNMSNGLHRRKLTLALQEKRDPISTQFPHAGKIDHNWVAFEWAHDCGLAHLTEVLTSHLVDGRVLNSLMKEDLKKYLKISKKVDQLSFLSGVELLRMHDFNREAIQEHRRQSQNALYWTNRDVADWLYSVDLQDYANSVIGGGVHGALLFLERSRFTADHLANIIQIPTSKGQLRRHLAGKMAALFSEDFSGSMDHLPYTALNNSTTMLSYSPLNLSPGTIHSQPGSQSPTHNHTPLKPPSGSTTPNDCLHPSRKNSLSRRAAMQMSPLHNTSRSPPSMRRTGSGPHSSVRGVASASPSSFQRSNNQLDASERVRLSLRESALRSMREEPPHSNRTVTPTVLSSTPNSNRTATPTNNIRTVTPTVLSSTTV